MQGVQLRRGFTRIAVQAHAAALGGFANNQHQGARRIARAVFKVRQRGKRIVLVKHTVQGGQLLTILVIAGDKLPRGRRFHAGCQAVEGFLERLMVDNAVHHNRVQDQAIQQRKRHQPAPWRGNVNRAQAGPEENSHGRIDQRDEDNLQAEVLAQVFAGFVGVGLKHHEQHALRELLPVDNEIAQRRQRRRPQHHANHRRNQADTVRE